jgi:hypothetical protein
VDINIGMGRERLRKLADDINAALAARPTGLVETTIYAHDNDNTSSEMIVTINNDDMEDSNPSVYVEIVN